ncbi:MAG TPA: AAA family ATPase [Chloroflexota bacterium]|nr:AAA family ATPase [Chloroflexota bacterium]
MNGQFPFVPGPPDWQFDWDAINDAFPWVRLLSGCAQEPEYHGEGDVWIHTRLVCKELVASSGFRSRTTEERSNLFAAALLHDVAKPVCTREEGGRLTSRGHSRVGAVQARAILWRLGLPIVAREQIIGLVRHHQRPFYLIESTTAQRQAIEASQTARSDLLAVLAEADARGRLSAGKQRLLENTALFIEFCRELGCLVESYEFPSDHARFTYFRAAGRDPTYLAYDDTGCEVVLMSGLPGAGKNRWITRHLPDWSIVSLDAIRDELGIKPTDPQAAVVHRAREMARSFLRSDRPFVWNATSLSRSIRDECIALFASYRARVRIVYVECPEEQLLRQNRERARPVPETVIERLLARWEVPDLTEAHRVDWIVGD